MITWGELTIEQGQELKLLVYGNGAQSYNSDVKRIWRELQGLQLVDLISEEDGDEIVLTATPTDAGRALVNSATVASQPDGAGDDPYTVIIAELGDVLADATDAPPARMHERLTSLYEMLGAYLQANQGAEGE